MLAGRAEIQDAGITHVVDNRIEWSDGKLVRAHAPNLGFMWNGADDVGQLMPDAWLDLGGRLRVGGIDGPDAQVLAHCHMGINRSPAMAYGVRHRRAAVDPHVTVGQDLGVWAINASNAKPTPQI
ncbi:MAG TPA: hypothetical protein VFC57_03885 [Aeromicrobium sp.]|nr:hypothetical protein [Aeromicrobium sp.]